MIELLHTGLGTGTNFSGSRHCFDTVSATVFLFSRMEEFIMENYEMLSQIKPKVGRPKKVKPKVGRPRRRPDFDTLEMLLSGHTVEQIAYMFDVKPGTIYAWVSRAKSDLKMAEKK